MFSNRLYKQFIKTEKLEGKKIRAARFHAPKKDLRIEEVERPSPAPNQVLIKTEATGICGSDLHIIEGETSTSGVPRILGHEASGVVVKTGENVEGWKSGDEVAVDPILHCGNCYFCRNGRENICEAWTLIGIHKDGAMADYFVAPARNLVKVPSDVSVREAALLTDSVATPFHAINKINLKAGQSFAIFGVGGIGAHAVSIAKLVGASPVIAVDIRQGAVERAKKFGADYSINSKKTNPVRKIRDITNGGGDVTMEAVGARETLNQAVKTVRRGGKVVLIGLTPQKMEICHQNDFVRNEYVLTGSYAFSKEDIKRAMKLVELGCLDLSQSVTSVYSLEDVNRGIEELREKNPVRILITP